MKNKIDTNILKTYISNDYIKCVKHPKENLFIYNYTQKTQYERFWDDITMQCRGIVLDEVGNIIAKPFDKFFNIEEHNENDIPKNKNFEVFDKVDGSLIIVFNYKDKWHVCTKGSFTSEQSIKARDMIWNKYDYSILNNYKDYTFLFEIVYPENRIVVNYGLEEDLHLITAINIEDYSEKNYDELLEFSKLFGSKIVKRYDGVKDFKKIRENLNETNKEGFVVRFENGFRLKMKYEEYCKLHKVVTNLSNKVIWEHLKERKDICDILDNVPDEMFSSIKEIVNDFNKRYDEIINECVSVYKVLDSRKDTAIYFKEQKYPHILFSMLDEKDYSDDVWKLLKPKYERVLFNVEE